mmetsp:Transcript_80164/g.214164  ORF Transcript_80164/g.214164 Transcript_80164/m.214164 type:complete len:291 (-) Transcript_80164:448-1320(-)
MKPGGVDLRPLLINPFRLRCKRPKDRPRPRADPPHNGHQPPGRHALHQSSHQCVGPDNLLFVGVQEVGVEDAVVALEASLGPESHQLESRRAHLLDSGDIVLTHWDGFVSQNNIRLHIIHRVQNAPCLRADQLCLRLQGLVVLRPQLHRGGQLGLDDVRVHADPQLRTVAEVEALAAEHALGELPLPNPPCQLFKLDTRGLPVIQPRILGEHVGPELAHGEGLAGSRNLQREQVQVHLRLRRILRPGDRRRPVSRERAWVVRRGEEEETPVELLAGANSMEHACADPEDV